MIEKLLRETIAPILAPLIALIPNKNKRQELEHDLLTRLVSAIAGLVQGQIDLNKQEAQHGSVFVAGWRPAIGWICGAGLAWNFILQPIVGWIVFVAGLPIEGAPKLDISDLIAILLGMLGLGGFRTIEKIRGVARGSL